MSAEVKKWLKKNTLPLLSLVFLTFIVYLNTLKNGLVADDIPGILNNPQLTNPQIIFSNPLFFIQPLFYFILIRLFDLNPFVLHLHNVVFHVLTVVMVYLVISVYSNKKLAFFTAALFAVHPLLSEPVAWISGGNYVKGTFFALTSLFFYFQYSKKSRFELFITSIFFYLLALASTTQAVVLPLIILFYEFIFGAIAKKAIAFSTYFLLAFVYIMLYFNAIPQRIAELNSIYEPASRFYNPLVQIPHAIGTYLSLFVFPYNLTLNYSAFIPLSNRAFDYVFLIIFISALIYTGLKHRSVFFFLGFFFISLFPTLLPLRIASIVAERYAYFGAIGLMFAASYFLTKLKRTGTVIFLVVILLLSSRTIIRNRDWKDQATLWTKTVETSPYSFASHYNLAGVYIEKGDYEKAVFELKKVLELAPNFAEGYIQLGTSYRKLGMIDNAIRSYQVSIKIKPDSWIPYQNLAALFFQKQQFKDAEQMTLIAIQLHPNSQILYKNLGMIYEALGDKDKSEAAYDKANALGGE